MRAARSAVMEREKVAAVAVVLAVVVVGSLVSPLRLPTPGLAGWDKLQHAVAYFVLALVSFYAAETENYKIAVVVFALGTCVELAQAFVPYRTASLLDAAANGFGVAVALCVAWCARYVRDVRKM